MIKDNLRYQPCSKADDDAWIAEQKIPSQFQNPKFPYQLISLCLNNKPLLDAYAVFGRIINSEFAISPRDRELLIIRCAVKSKSIYEWEHHKEIAESVSITDKELEALKSAVPRENSAIDLSLINACDELIAMATWSDVTFHALAESFSTSEIMEIISVIGFYHWTAMLLYGLKVPLEAALLEK